MAGRGHPGWGCRRSQTRGHAGSSLSCISDPHLLRTRALRHWPGQLPIKQVQQLSPAKVLGGRVPAKLTTRCRAWRGLLPGSCLGFLHESVLRGRSGPGRRRRAALPGLESPWSALGWHLCFRRRSLALSLWRGPLSPRFPDREGQVVAVILQLALASESWASSAGVALPPAPPPTAPLAWRLQRDPNSRGPMVPSVCLYCHGHRGGDQAQIYTTVLGSLSWGLKFNSERKKKVTLWRQWESS